MADRQTLEARRDSFLADNPVKFEHGLRDGYRHLVTVAIVDVTDDSFVGFGEGPTYYAALEDALNKAECKDGCKDV